MRARDPDVEDIVVRDEVRIGYEVYEPRDRSPATPTVLLPTSMPLVHARQWKGQVPFLARHFRVVVVDGRGNGRSDRPSGPEAYALEQDIADLVAVLDATATTTAVVVGISGGARRALALAADRPGRVSGVVAIAPALVSRRPDFDEVRGRYEGPQRVNRHYIAQDYRSFVEFWHSTAMSDPHTSAAFDEAVAWSNETTAQVVIDYFAAQAPRTLEWARSMCARVRCPVVVVHGDADLLVPHDAAVAVAEWTGGKLVTLPGVGHVPPISEPIAVNLLIRDFIQSVTGWQAPSTRRRPARRRRRALFLSSPIGLGHARRDLAIAAELRALQPDLDIEWLAQHPVTAALATAAERVHPASALLASETAHIDGLGGEHDAPALHIMRSMSEILIANFHVLADLIENERYDLVVGDEAWELDHFLHENPGLKRSAYAWLTDFVGYLPLPEGGGREEILAADHNAQMLEQIARHPQLRDRALLIGEPDDVVSDDFGPGLPRIREWTEAHYDFTGYVTGFTPIDPRDRAAVREELGWRPGEPVLLVTAGGTGLGLPLLRRVTAALPEANRRVPGLRTIVVAGPRVDPAAIPTLPGLEVHGWVPDLYRRLGACDMAVTHAGLTTCMELTANRRPFIYVPLRRHFEQNRHVPHRLRRYRAGRRMNWDELSPDALADAIATDIGRNPDYRPVDPDGATRAAAHLFALI